MTPICAQRLTADTLFTRVGAMIGTPEYMSPEQFDAGEDIDTRTDVFPLGVVLYQLLSGAVPIDFRKLGFDVIVRAIREQDAPRSSTKLRTSSVDQASTIARNRRTDPKLLYRQLRGDLDVIALKAVEKDRSRRYGAPSELAADIGKYLSDEPILARHAGFFYRAKKSILRNKVAVAATATIVVVLGVFSVTEAAQLRRITEERNQLDGTVEFMTHMFDVPHRGMGPGLSVTAEEILNKAYRDVQSDYGRDPVMQGRLEDALAEIYFDLGGSNARADKLARDALNTLTNANGAQDRETLRATRVLARTLLAGSNTQQAAESEKTLRETLAADRRVMGSMDPETLRCMAVLASMTFPSEWTKDTGKFMEPEMLMREAFEGRLGSGRRAENDDRQRLGVAEGRSPVGGVVGAGQVTAVRST